MKHSPQAANLPTDLREWENEGGAQGRMERGVKIDGITIRQIREYVVGPYRYTDYASALAERTRQRSQAKGG
jgi:hypothetical protein